MKVLLDEFTGAIDEGGGAGRAALATASVSLISSCTGVSPGASGRDRRLTTAVTSSPRDSSSLRISDPILPVAPNRIRV